MTLETETHRRTQIAEKQIAQKRKAREQAERRPGACAEYLQRLQARTRVTDGLQRFRAEYQVLIHADFFKTKARKPFVQRIAAFKELF